MQKKSESRKNVTVIKKYSNRRLYDTEQSRYITLDELSHTIREGRDVQVVDVKSGQDLTQGTLTQIIMESRGAAKLLPSSLLMQLIRMEDEDLAEFLTRYIAAALELYQTARRSADRVAPFNPFAEVPFAATNAVARLFTGAMNLGGKVLGRDEQAPAGESYARPEEPLEAEAPADAAPPTEASSSEDAVAMMRRELDELKALIMKNNR
ncbi:MAG: polyhydroxyalkanoate synthesis repressor PhaR [Myxococcota bacterium]|jgi:polyhydroxyalkanoate synthesis repressor PhaR